MRARETAEARGRKKAAPARDAPGRGQENGSYPPIG